jgi:hypothetical protein
MREYSSMPISVSPTRCQAHDSREPASCARPQLTLQPKAVFAWMLEHSLQVQLDRPWRGSSGAWHGLKGEH